MITLLKRYIKYLPVLTLALFSCSNKITEGKIVNKFHEPPRQYIVTEYDVVLKMPVVRSKYNDEAYVLVVESITKGDTITEKREVTYRIYNSYNVGDSVKFEQ